MKKGKGEIRQPGDVLLVRLAECYEPGARTVLLPQTHKTALRATMARLRALQLCLLGLSAVRGLRLPTASASRVRAVRMEFGDNFCARLRFTLRLH